MLFVTRFGVLALVQPDSRPVRFPSASQSDSMANQMPVEWDYAAQAEQPGQAEVVRQLELLVEEVRAPILTGRSVFRSPAKSLTDL